MRLALLGGSFNPVHLGHLYVAEAVRRALGYERVLFVPASIPVHKPLADGASAEHRLAMLRLALAGRTDFAVEDCELRRGGKSYTIDTVRELLQRYPVEGKPGLIIGDDLAPEFHTWKQPAELASLVDLIVARRVGTNPAVSGTGPAAAGACLPGNPGSGRGFPCTFVDNPPHPASSSEIRRRLRQGQSVQGMLPESVRRYIERHGLYA